MVGGSSAMSDRNKDDAAYRGLGLAGPFGSRDCGRKAGL